MTDLNTLKAHDSIRHLGLDALTVQKCRLDAPDCAVPLHRKVPQWAGKDLWPNLHQVTLCPNYTAETLVL